MRRFRVVVCVAMAVFSLAAGGCSSGGTIPLPPPDDSAAGRQVTERFGISVDRNYVYNLAFPPDPARAVAVYYGDTLLAEQVDYALRGERRAVRLLRAFPPDTSASGMYSLRVVYQKRTE